MKKILLSIDGSKSALRAVAYVLNLAKQGLPLELELLNVQIQDQ